MVINHLLTGMILQERVGPVKKISRRLEELLSHSHWDLGQRLDQQLEVSWRWKDRGPEVCRWWMESLKKRWPGSSQWLFGVVLSELFRG